MPGIGAVFFAFGDVLEQDMSKIPLIAVHGAGMGPGVWDALAGHIPLRALALPGHGDGRVPLASIAGMAEWVTGQINAPCILTGHSMGALVALEAAGHPLIKALILLGAAAEMPVHPDLLRQARETPEMAAELILKWSIYGPNPEVKDRLRETMKNGLSALGTDLAACNEYKLLKSIGKPTLILAGAEDRMVKPAGSEALSHLLPQSNFKLVPATGHMMMAENPAATAAAMASFLSNISSISI